MLEKQYQNPYGVWVKVYFKVNMINDHQGWSLIDPNSHTALALMKCPTAIRPGVLKTNLIYSTMARQRTLTVFKHSCPYSQPDGLRCVSPSLSERDQPQQVK
jgi:hypothetical protein